MNKLLSYGGKIFLYLLLSFLTLLFVVPFLYALYNSLLPLSEVDRLVPISHFSLDNYVTLFTKYKVQKWLMNTVVMTFIIVVGNVVLTSMAGYALAKFRFPGKKVISFMVIITMMVPYQLIVTPLYLTIVNIGWNNTMASITVPYLCQCVYVFFTQQYFQSIPPDLEEAARLDGLSRGGVFFRIVVPISKPALTTIIILCFTGTWNSYFVPATFITEEKLYPLVVGLNTIKARYFARPNLSLAGVILLTIPVLVVYVIFQKWFIQGVASTGIKE